MTPCCKAAVRTCCKVSSTQMSHRWTKQIATKKGALAVRHTLSVLVENQAGVLSRISGLFSRRGFNIESLAVGVTENKNVSRMTIVVSGDDYVVEQVEKQLNKLIDVIRVRLLQPEDIITRELMLIKVNATASGRSDIIDIVKIMGANVVDISKTTLTLEVSDTPDRLEVLVDLLKPYGIREMMRTGTIALQKGAPVITK